MKAKQLQYLFCEDWLIYMYSTKTKELFQYCTELMQEWLNYPEHADQEENAVEKYMMPIVLRENRMFKNTGYYWDEITKEIIAKIA